MKTSEHFLPDQILIVVEYVNDVDILISVDIDILQNLHNHIIDYYSYISMMNCKFE